MATEAIPNELIDSLIKSAELDHPNSGTTKGKDLRLLLKLMRDRMEQQLAGGGFNNLVPAQSGLVQVSGGVEQVTVTQNLILDVKDRTPGRSGSLIVIQDTTGLHSITLAPLNQGLVTNVAEEPNTVTRLEWENASDFTIWTAEVIVPAVVINAPEAITDLAALYTDTTSTLIKWTAPDADPPKGETADSYTIYLSGAPITAETDLASLSVYKNLVKPKAPGEQEQLSLTGLNPMQTFYLAIAANKTIFGQTRTGAASNIVSFVTLPLEGTTATRSVQIPVKPENVGSYMLGFAKDVNGVVLDEKHLVDYSNVSIQFGVPVGQTPTTEMVHTDDFKAFYNEIQYVIFDFEDKYRLDQVYLFIGEHPVPDVSVQVSQDGTTFIAVATIPGGYVGATDWRVANIPLASQHNIRYVKFAFAQQDGGVLGTLNGAVFMGAREQQINISGVKYKRPGEQLSLKKRIGTNGFVVDNYANLEQLAGIVRLYHGVDWFCPVKRNEAVSLTTVHYGFEFAPFGGPPSPYNFDAAYADLAGRGLDLLFTLTTMPPFLAESELNDNDASTRKPLDPGHNLSSLSDTTNPLNYQYIAQFYWQVAKRYGGDATARDASLYRLSPGETVKNGLGYFKYWELGQNEAALTGLGSARYTNAEEQAAILSAIWDGHKGAMGPGFGIKDADPNAIPVMAGLPGTTLEYTKTMFRWWDVNRGLGDYPIRVINQHYYNTSDNSQSVSTPGVYGLPPEKGNADNFIRSHVNYRDSHQFIQNCEFWITEFGWDEHLGAQDGSPYFNPADPEGSADRRGYDKAIWIVRFMALSAYQGLDRAMQYAYDGVARRSELSNTQPNIFNIFFTSGYFDGSPGDQTKPPLAAYHYAVAFRKAFEGFKFSHAVMIKGLSQTTTTICRTTDPNLYVLAYQPDNTAQKPFLIAWLGVDVNSSVIVTFNVSPGDVNIDMLSFKGIEKDPSGRTEGYPSQVTSVVDGDGRKLLLEINECPQIIYLTDVGLGRLLNPADIKIVALGTNQIKLAWTDANIGQNKTKIFRNLNPDANFYLIFDDYIDNGEYMDHDPALQPDTTYYYQLQFYNGLVTSDLTASYGQTTAHAYAVPGNFGAGETSANSIPLAWTYSAADAALIDGFELWKAATPTGEYTKVTDIDPGATSYLVEGLTENTPYSFKIRAFKGFFFSDYSLTVTTTTSSATGSPPVVNTLETNYAGDRISLRYNLSMMNPAGNESKYTVTETFGATVSHYTVLQASLMDGHDNIIHLRISGQISPGNTVSIGYDGNTGTVESIYHIKAPAFSNRSVVNRAKAADLLSKLIKVNFTLPAKLPSPAGTNWNDVDVTINDPNGQSGQAVVNALVTSAGVATSISLVVCNSHDNSGSTSSGVNDQTDNPGYAPPTDPINDLFPTYTRLCGYTIANWNGGLVVGLTNVDPLKEYNVYVYGTFFSDDNLEITINDLPKVYYEEGSQVAAFLTDIKPGIYALPIASGSAGTVPGLSNPLLQMRFRAIASNMGLMGLLIEEVIPN